MALLDVQHLEGRTLADVVHVLLVGQAIETDTAIVRDVVRLHDLVDAFQHEHRLVVVGLHGFINDLGQLRVVAHEEPGINRDTVSADTGAGLEDVHARVHIADLDDLIYIHIVVPTDAAEFISKSNVNSTVGVFNNLGHLGGTDVGNYNLALAEAGIVALHLLADLLAVGADGAVVMQQFVHHVAGDDPLRGMHQVDILANLKAVGLDDGAHVLIDGARAHRGFDHDGRTLRADFHHVLDGGDHIAGVHLLAELVVRRGDRDDVHVGLLVLCGELDAFRYGRLKKFIQTILLEGGLTGIQRSHQVFVVIRADDLNTMRGHHQCGGQSNIAQSNYVDHIIECLYYFCCYLTSYLSTASPLSALTMRLQALPSP